MVYVPVIVCAAFRKEAYCELRTLVLPVSMAPSTNPASDSIKRVINTQQHPSKAPELPLGGKFTNHNQKTNQLNKNEKDH